jgi:hypothetical protein
MLVIWYEFFFFGLMVLGVHWGTTYGHEHVVNRAGRANYQVRWQAEHTRDLFFGIFDGRGRDHFCYNAAPDSDPTAGESQYVVLEKLLLKNFCLGNLCKLKFFPRNRRIKFKNFRMNKLGVTLALLSLLASANSYSLDTVGNQCSAASDCDPPFILCSAATSLCTHKSILPITGTEIIGL